MNPHDLHVSAMLKGIAGHGFQNVNPFDQTDVALTATATEPRGGSTVRIKFANPRLWLDASGDADANRRAANERLLVEAHCLERIGSHPNVLALKGTGEVAGDHYLVLEHPDGVTLDTISKAVPFGDFLARLAQSVGFDLAGTIGFLHGKGVAVHTLTRTSAVLKGNGQMALTDLSFAQPIDLNAVTVDPKIRGKVENWRRARLAENAADGVTPVARDVRALAALVLRLVVTEEYQDHSKLLNLIGPLSKLKASDSMHPVRHPALRQPIYHLLNLALVRAMQVPDSFPGGVAQLGESFRMTIPIAGPSALIGFAAMLKGTLPS